MGITPGHATKDEAQSYRLQKAKWKRQNQYINSFWIRSESKRIHLECHDVTELSRLDDITFVEIVFGKERLDLEPEFGIW